MEYLVYVDSNNRDQALWPDSNFYQLHLTTPILNIQSVELVSAMLPNLAASQFVTLDIVELRTPNHLTADAMLNSSNTLTSNAFGGSFATIPIKITGTSEFYNANYKIVTDYPSHIDKLDRLTINWRQPNSKTLVEAGRNMFLLKFVTAKPIFDPERAISLPEPVEWNRIDQTKIFIIIGIALAGLFIIISLRSR